MPTDPIMLDQALEQPGAVPEITESSNDGLLRLVLAAVRDGIAMIDDRGRACLWNDAAERILGYSRSEIIGKDLHSLLVPARYRAPQMAAMRHFQMTGKGAVIDRTVELRALRKDQTEIAVELSLSALEIEDRWYALAVIRDVTERKKIEMQRDLLLKSLEEALASVKTLRGLVPICAACKKIRDDQGYWNNVESYVAAHSEAKFSHGICPDCVCELYPEVAPAMKSLPSAAKTTGEDQTKDEKGADPPECACQRPGKSAGG